jgi:signal transduction histidine kinase
MNTRENLIQRFFPSTLRHRVTTTITGDALLASQRRRLLNILIVTALVLLGILTLLNLTIWSYANPYEDPFTLLSDLVTVAFFVGLLLLNRAGYTTVAAYIFLLLTTFAATLFFPADALEPGIIMYAVPTITASFVIRPRSSLFFGTLSFVAYWISHLVQGTEPYYGYIAVPTLVMIAIIAWLSAGQLEKAVRTAYEKNLQLESALQAKDTMLQNVSHELRTPLVLIIGYSELLLDGVPGNLNSDQQRALTVIRDRSFALSHLVDNLLAFQKLTPEKYELQPVDIKRLVAEVWPIWEQRAAGKGINLHSEFIGDILPIQAEERLLARAIDQLLDNAIKFTPPGGEVMLRVEPHDGREVRLTISDTGIGIAPDKLEKIFEPFYQVDGSTTRRYNGVGIGLYLAREVIHFHGGRIWAESDGLPGHGTTFHLALPAIPTVPVSAAQP